MAYGGALLRRWWQHRVGSNPTPSVRPLCRIGHGRAGRVAEWLKAHDWKSCGHSPRGFESHPVRYMYAVRIRTHAIFAEDRRVGSSRATQVGTAKRRPRRLARRRRVAPSIPPRLHYRRPVVFGAWLSPVERCVRVAEVPGSNPGAPICSAAKRPVFCLSLERWQNGIALASKASARKGLGVRIPRAPYLPSRSGLEGFFVSCGSRARFQGRRSSEGRPDDSGAGSTRVLCSVSRNVPWANSTIRRITSSSPSSSSGR